MKKNVLVGHHPENSITFKTSAAALSHMASKSIEYLEFEFRTIQENIESLVTLKTGELTAQISLLNSYTFQLKIKENKNFLVESTIKSQSK